MSRGYFPNWMQPQSTIVITLGQHFPGRFKVPLGTRYYMKEIILHSNGRKSQDYGCVCFLIVLSLGLACELF
jgi:hypothetical protein